MRIAIVNWPINAAGGINSYCENMFDGLKAIGHDPVRFYGIPGQSLKCSPDKKTKQSGKPDLLPAYPLSYHPNLVKESIDTLNGFDLIFFQHAGPHPTKSNMAIDHIENWKLFYTDTKPKKGLILHDDKWPDNNTWILDVQDTFSFVLAGQIYYMKHINTFTKDCLKFWDYQPMDIPFTEMPTLDGRKDIGLCCGQWISLKRPRVWVPQLKDVKLTMHMHGIGIEYWQIRADGILKDNIGYDHYYNEVCNPNLKHEFFGFTEYKELLQKYTTVKYSFDTSTNPEMNQTVVEAMTRGTIITLDHRKLDGPDIGEVSIPDDCFVTYDIYDFANAINELIEIPYDELKPIAENAWKFIQRAEKTKWAKRVMDQIGAVI